MAMSGGVVLVTGAAGYIGEALVRALAARGDVRRILAFDQSPPDRRPLPGSADASAYARVEPIVGDLADLALAERLLDAEVDVVFHLASLVSGGAEADYARGLRVVMMAARHVRARPGRIAVAALQPLVREIFEISRFHHVVEVFPSMREGLAALSASALQAFDTAQGRGT